MNNIWREDHETGDGPFSCSWLINATWAHPIWSQYVCALYDLTTVVEPPTKTVIHLPGATHEMILFALDPDTPVVRGTPLDEQGMKMLQPPNYGYQFISESNEAARDRIERVMESIDVKQLSPDTDSRHYWNTHLFPDAFPLVGGLPVRGFTDTLH